MKKLLLILFCLINITFLKGANYYISPTGSDATGNGTRGNPYFTLTKAMTYCSAGDNVIALKGTYNYSTGQVINKSGTAGNYITVKSEALNPDSVIFDFYTYDVSGEAPKSIYGIYSIDDNYIKIQGITIKRLWKINQDNGQAYGFYIQNATKWIFNNCVADSIAGRGYQCHNSADIFYYNCDAIWCADPQLADPGNGGSGFVGTSSGTGTGSMNDSLYYKGCRAWYCADQGFSGSTGANYTIYDSCWTFANGLQSYGFTSGAGDGLKLGFVYYDVDSIQMKITHVLAAFNVSYGMDENTSANGYKFNIRAFNNTFYKNGIDGIKTDTYTTNTDNINKYVNNISFGNTRYDMYIASSAIHYYNSFDRPYCPACASQYITSPATVNAEDFLSLPTNATNCVQILAATRKSGGWLPDIGEYFKLKPLSDLVDAGIDVGLAYDGTAPDLGAFEYIEVIPPFLPEATTSAITVYNAYQATLNGEVTSDGGGTITASGFVYGTSSNPTLSDGVLTTSNVSEASISGIIRKLAGGTSYHVRSYVTNGLGTTYGSDQTFTTPANAKLQSGGKVIMNNGKIIIYK